MDPLGFVIKFGFVLFVLLVIGAGLLCWALCKLDEAYRDDRGEGDYLLPTNTQDNPKRK